MNFISSIRNANEVGANEVGANEVGANEVGANEVDAIVLKIFISTNEPGVHYFYNKRMELHNDKFQKDEFMDSGFDLSIISDQILDKTYGNKIKLSIHAAMWNNGKPCGYYLFPRSSISKTPIRLSNSVGIIDSGYRGELMAMTDVLNSETGFKIVALERYFQICHPTLKPFHVEIVSSIDELGKTSRGDGGFGSTGK